MNGYLKPALVTIAAAVEKMMLPLAPNYEKDDNQNNVRQRLFIHDMQIADRFVIKPKTTSLTRHLSVYMTTFPI